METLGISTNPVSWIKGYEVLIENLSWFPSAQYICQITTDITLKEHSVSLMYSRRKLDILRHRNSYGLMVVQYQNLSDYIPIEPWFNPQGPKARNGTAHLHLMISG